MRPKHRELHPDLRIDELVLDGVAPGDQELLDDALRAELAPFLEGRSAEVARAIARAVSARSQQ